jgi:hypothetical protein
VSYVSIRVRIKISPQCVSIDVWGTEAEIGCSGWVFSGPQLSPSQLKLVRPQILLSRVFHTAYIMCISLFRVYFSPKLVYSAYSRIQAADIVPTPRTSVRSNIYGTYLQSSSDFDILHQLKGRYPILYSSDRRMSYEYTATRIEN